MKILHTSDWHLGQSFMGKSRQEEHYAFFTWLLDTIKNENIDTLIVAGDIFDTTTPPNYALELYYNFLTALASECKNIIIIAGNHDSVATLKAPQQLLKALNIHLITSGDTEESELVAIYSDNKSGANKLEGIICAVPFLRDYVVRESLEGESMSDKEHALSKGIKAHYRSVYEEAKLLRENHNMPNVPIIATGHLTTVGSKTSESEREIYIGGTLDIDSHFLGKYFDYVALGHLHINQKVGSEYIRYSGSPIPLSFSEAKQQKKVNIIEFHEGSETGVEVHTLDIPLYRQLLVIRGDVEAIVKELEDVAENSSEKELWIEVHIRDDNPYYANETIRDIAKALGLTLLAVKIEKVEQALHSEDFNVISLDDLDPIDLFQRRIEQESLDDEAFAEELLINFKAIVAEVQNR